MSLFVGNKIIGWWGIKSIIKSQVAQENVHVTLPQFFFSPPKRNERNLKNIYTRLHQLFSALCRFHCVQNPKYMSKNNG